MQRVVFQNRDIYYHVQGAGEPLVLVHGYLMSSLAWGRLPELLAKQYKVITPDLPGHGKSATYPKVHSMDLMAEAVKAILDAEGIDKFHLIGHSMGGYVSLAFMECYSGMVKSLTLLNSTPFADTQEQQSVRDDVIKLINGNKVEFFLKLAIQELLNRNNQSKLSTTLFEQAAGQGRQSIIATTKGIQQRPDRSKHLKKGNIPIQWIMGSNDKQLDLSAVIERGKKEGLPEAKLLDTGHMGFLDKPELIFGEIIGFIKNQP